MDMKSIPVLKKKEIGDHDYLLGNWKGADFDVFL